jgi:hypothetical protein
MSGSHQVHESSICSLDKTGKPKGGAAKTDFAGRNFIADKAYTLADFIRKGHNIQWRISENVSGLSAQSCVYL